MRQEKMESLWKKKMLNGVMNNPKPKRFGGGVAVLE